LRAAGGGVEQLDDSTAVAALQRSGTIALDPLRLCVHFSGVAEATAVDDDLCERDGIYCELNDRSCITYAVPAYSSLVNRSFEALSSALLEVAASTSGQKELSEGADYREVQAKEARVDAALPVSLLSVTARDFAGKSSFSVGPHIVGR